MHLGVKADVLPPGTDCHHIILEDWEQLEEARGVLFLSMPSLLDPTLAPEGQHIVHAFTPDWIDAWQGLSPEEYERKKEEVAESLCKRIEAVFPGISKAIRFKEVSSTGSRTHCSKQT
jgi:prolycopene isomerase